MRFSKKHKKKHKKSTNSTIIETFEPKLNLEAKPNLVTNLEQKIAKFISNNTNSKLYFEENL